MPRTRPRQPFAEDPLRGGTVPTATKDYRHQLTLDRHASPSTPLSDDQDRAAEIRVLRRHFAGFLRRLRDRVAEYAWAEFQAADFTVFLNNHRVEFEHVDRRAVGGVIKTACSLGIIEPTGEHRPNGGAPGSNYNSTVRPVYRLLSISKIPGDWQ